MYSDALKTLSSDFKGAVFVYLNQALTWNKQNVRNFTFKICKERFLLNQRVFYFPRDFYLVEEINYQLSVMSANGILDHFTSEYADYNYLNIKALTSRPSPINIQQVSAIFYLWIAGLTLASLFFMAELVYHCAKKIKNHRLAHQI